jgi:ADP-ribose pyrophosphatase YjhB (NUDIX family)
MKNHPARFCMVCGTSTEIRHLFDRERPVCPSCGWINFFDPKVAVEILVEQGDEVLLVHRLNEPGLGMWSLPGGFMDGDEEPERAAERECREETGLEVVVTRLIAVMSDREFANSADLVIAYAAQVTGGALLAGDDAGDARFFRRDALPPVAFRVARKVLGLKN